MLTGDLKPSGGTAFLGELDMLKRAEDVRSLMGYCPQADALDELLTAEEVCASCFMLAHLLFGTLTVDVNSPSDATILRASPGRS
jgi:ABC-type multidrug transport system ATPase subunit